MDKKQLRQTARRVQARGKALWQRKWVRVTAVALAVPLVLAFFLTGYYYIRFAQLLDDRLHGTLLQQRIRLERWLSAIALTASISPLLGLLGTVSGMITTFQAMSLFGAGDTSAVSGGVGEALINTELGLVVAIPALLAHALLSRKAKSYLAQLESDAINLSRLPFRTGAA